MNHSTASTVSLTELAGFDLWEEVEGRPFFTLVAQHRALVEGSALAAELDVSCDNCDSEAPQIRCAMGAMWQEEGFMLTDKVDSNEREGLGTNTIIASVHS